MFSKYLKSKFKKDHKKNKLVSLSVQNENEPNPYVVKLPKHLLVENSRVFKNMADNGELKKSREIKLEGITDVALKKIAEYIGQASVTFQDHYEAIETLKAATIYQVQVMFNICSDFLITVINIGNVCEIYEFAIMNSHYTLEYYCLKFIDQYTGCVLLSPGFLTLEKSTVMNIIKRNSLNISSDIVIFRAVLTWGLNDCLRHGVDAENIDEFLNSVKPLMACVKFLTMTKEEMADPDVEKFFNLLHSDDSSNKRKSLLGLESRHRTSSVDSSCLQPRKYITEYIYDFEAQEYDEHAVRNGENFRWRIEILKGRVFLTEVTLAFDTFVNMKNTACLCVTLTATNIQTMEQKSARGTFLNTSEDGDLKFPSPLVAKELERIEISLNVKRAENICPMKIRNEIQIAMPDSKEIAMKITPCSTSGETERCIFKNIKYFF